jgi:hypothetical protein
MPRPIKYDYDINHIADMRNKGFSINEIARRKGWPLNATHSWIKNNFIEKISYKRREKGKNEI